MESWTQEQIKANRTGDTEGQPEVQFSRGRSGARGTLSVEDVQRLARSVLGVDPIKARVSVVKPLADLPDVVRRAIAADSVKDGEIKALHWRGRSWLIADEMSSAQDVAEAIYHEHYTHGGLRAKWGCELGPKLDGLAARVGGLDGLRKLADGQKIDLSEYESALAGHRRVSPANCKRVGRFMRLGTSRWRV